MLNGNRKRNAVTAAALAGSLLMGLSGLVYRTVAAPVERVPLDSNALAWFPLQIGEWAGQEVPIDPDIREVIDADAYISRRYSRRNGTESIGLYMPCGADAPQLLQHVPENCYLGGGWTLVDRHPIELALREGRTLPCSIVLFARSGLDMQRLLLLHFLVADGECFTTFSALAKTKGWRHFAGIDYAGQVQIVTSANRMTTDSATKVVTDFALDAAPIIEQLFERLEATPTAAESQGPVLGE